MHFTPLRSVHHKVDIPKRRDDEMNIFLRTSSSAVLESSIPSMAHHRSTSRSGLRVASLEFTGLEVAHRMHGAELLAFLFSKVADAAREHQTHDQPTEKWNVLFGQDVLRAWVSRHGRRPNESKCHASRCECQWHPGWSWLCLFITRSCPQLSAESDFEGPRSDPRSRALSKK